MPVTCIMIRVINLRLALPTPNHLTPLKPTSSSSLKLKLVFIQGLSSLAWNKRLGRLGIINTKPIFTSSNPNFFKLSSPYKELRTTKARYVHWVNLGVCIFVSLVIFRALSSDHIWRYCRKSCFAGSFLTSTLTLMSFR
jgi:hypothetical protein